MAHPDTTRHPPCAFLLIFLLLSLSSCGGATSVPPTTHQRIILYVSPAGDDRYDGRRPDIMDESAGRGPFQTLKRARDEIRRLKSSRRIETATVLLRGGHYRLPDPLYLDERDSGTPGAPVIYRPYPGETVTLSGSLKLENCQLKSPTLAACLLPPEVAKHTPAFSDNPRASGNLPAFDLYDARSRLSLARWPNHDRSAPGGDAWAYTGTPGKTGKHPAFLHPAAAQLATGSESNPIVHLWPGPDWDDQLIDLQGIDGDRLLLATEPRRPLQAGRRFALLNMFSLMDQPGEWIYSQPQGTVYIRIRENTPLDFFVSTPAHLMKLRSARHIRFESLTFEASRDTAILIRDGESIEIRDCRVRNARGWGIIIHGGHNHRITATEINNPGLGGVLLAGGRRDILQASGHTISGSHIHHTGQIIWNGHAGLKLVGVGQAAKGNRIHHTPGPAVLIEGNDHLIKANDIHHACIAASDCGAVYSGRNWTFHGNTIRGNAIHDIYGYGFSHTPQPDGAILYRYPAHARGIYLDDAASGFRIVGNALYKISGNLIQVGGGRHNVIDNNLLIVRDKAIWIDARWPGYPWDSLMRDRLHEVPYDKEPWRSRYPDLALPMRRPDWPEGNRITHNVIVAETVPTGHFIPLRYILPSDATFIDHNIFWAHGGNVFVEYSFLDTGKQGLTPWHIWRQSTPFDRNSLLTDILLSQNNGRVTIATIGHVPAPVIQPLPLPLTAAIPHLPAMSTPPRLIRIQYPVARP